MAVVPAEKATDKIFADVIETTFILVGDLAVKNDQRHYFLLGQRHIPLKVNQRRRFPDVVAQQVGDVGAHSVSRAAHFAKTV